MFHRQPNIELLEEKVQVIVTPNYQDFMDEENEIFRPRIMENYVKFREYQSKQYLQQQFNLERESFIGRLRTFFNFTIKESTSIQMILDKSKQMKKDKFVKLFPLTYLVDWSLDRNGLVLQLQVQPTNEDFSQIEETIEAQKQMFHLKESLKLLKPNKLIILINSITGEIIFGKGVYFPPEINSQTRARNNLTVQQAYEGNNSYEINMQISVNESNFESILFMLMYTDKESRCPYHQFLLLDTSGFWQPHEQSLKAAYTMYQNDQQIPFQEQILQEMPLKSSDMFPRTEYCHSEAAVKRKRERIDQCINTSYQLDKSQKECLKRILTEKFLCIQGPVGTGKSLIISIAIAKMLQIQYYDVTKKYKPIIVVGQNQRKLNTVYEYIKQNNETSVNNISKGYSQLETKPFEYMVNDQIQILQMEADLKGQIEENLKIIVYDPKECANSENLISNAIDLVFPSLKKKLAELFMNIFFQSNTKYDVEQFQIIILNLWLIRGFNTDFWRFLPKQRQKREGQQEILNYLIKQDQEFDEYQLYNQPLMNYPQYSNVYQSNFNQVSEFEIQQMEQHCQKRNMYIEKPNVGVIQLFSAQFRRTISRIAISQIKLTKIQNLKDLYFEKLYSFIQEAKNQQTQRDVWYFSKFKVILINTSDFSKYHSAFRAIKPEVIFVCGAQDIKEWNCANLLLPSVKHFVQIGDIHQLTSTNHVHDNLERFNAESSLFKRLYYSNRYNEGSSKGFHRLTEQRTLSARISCFSRLIYLQDENNVFIDNAQAMEQLVEIEKKNQFQVPLKVAFFNHHFKSTKDDRSSSIENKFEIIFSYKLARLLVRNYEVPKEKITILCAYKKQQMNMKQYFKSQNFEVKSISSIDSYAVIQNDYVILSLVNSTCSRYMQSEERINTALTRAKHGIYVVGNLAEFAKQSQLWNIIVSKAEKTNSYFQNKNERYLPESFQVIFDKSIQMSTQQTIYHGLLETSLIISEISDSFTEYDSINSINVSDISLNEQLYEF